MAASNGQGSIKPVTLVRNITTSLASNAIHVGHQLQQASSQQPQLSLVTTQGNGLQLDATAIFSQSALGAALIPRTTVQLVNAQHTSQQEAAAHPQLLVCHFPNSIQS